MGHGGIRLVARARRRSARARSLGVDELNAGAEPLGRVRRPGGGRKRAAVLDPGLLLALLALVEPDERGDSVTPLRWMVKSTRNLAGELTTQRHKVSADTVGDLLRARGFSLQGNAKSLEGQRHPDRDAQFRYINEQVKAHQDTADPLISVDTKKKELVSQFASAGKEWRPGGQPVPVNSHDFPTTVRAGPYGIYDIAGNTRVRADLAGGPRLPVLECLRDGSWLSRFGGVPVRVIDARSPSPRAPAGRPATAR